MIFTAQKSITAAVLVWLLVIIVGSYSTYADVKLTKDHPGCFAKYAIGDTSKYFKTTPFFIAAYTIPMVALYIKIAYTAKKQASSVVAPSSQNNNTNTQNKNTDFKIIKMMVSILGMYFLSYIPIYIFAPMIDEKSPLYLHVIAYTFSIIYRSSTWMNVLIYSYMNKLFRKAFVQLLHLEKYLENKGVPRADTTMPNHMTHAQSI